MIRNATHDADMVDYDNSKTGLPATTIQDAVDQLHGIISINIEDIENKADKVISLINVDNSPIDDTFILYNLTHKKRDVKHFSSFTSQWFYALMLLSNSTASATHSSK